MMNALGVDSIALSIKSESPMSTKSDNSSSVSKVCSVCGDLALGYNFNAVSCESCKAFFRRNALKDKEFKCPFKEDCEMTPVTRRFCQRCRLRKCFAIGMRKEYIMSDEERLSKRQKIEQNRARKRGSQLNDGQTTKTKRTTSGQGEWLTMDSPNCTQDDPLSPQRSVDPLEPFPSPTTAASAGSIPSPDSPPEGAFVAASGTASDGVDVLAQLGSMADVDRMCLPASPSSAAVLPTKVLRTTWTQTQPPLVAPTTAQAPAQVPAPDTPLLTSLIRSPNSVREMMSPWMDNPASSADLGLVPEAMSPWTACLPDAGMPPGELARDALQDVFRVGFMPSSIESILSEAIRLEYSTYTPPLVSLSDSSLSGSSHMRELNDAERAKLNELIVANKALNIPIEDDIHHKSQDGEPVLIDIINLTAIAIRRLIKMTKKINAFKNMCQEDQVALLKGACMEMLILRGAMNYNPERDSWDLPSNSVNRTRNISINVLKEARGNLYHEHQRFQRSFDPRWRNDENIMLILSAIALFTPDRLCLIHHDVVRLEQNSYYYLLRRYLECTFPGCEARSTFLKLIQKMSELHRLNEEHVRAYLDVDPSEVEPLLIEIFDLKTKQ